MIHNLRPDYNNQELGSTKEREMITREPHSYPTHFVSNHNSYLCALEPKVRLWFIFLPVM
jgi:hypothetical protein